MGERSMTDAEIMDGFRAVGDKYGAAVAALTNIIQILQAQPGYDHQHFLALLATFQVGGERKPIGVPAFDKAYQDTLESFAKTPLQLPSLLRNLDRP